MPIASGASQKTFVENIKEMSKSYKRKGTIGTSTPKNAAAARKQILAIAYSKKRKSRTIAHG